MTFADDVDFALAENVAATTVRQLTGIRLAWGEMIATAQAVLSRADDLPPAYAPSLYVPGEGAPLIAAARILDSAADPRSGLSDDRQNLALLGVVAYAMHGNFASAAALATREGLIDPRLDTISPTIAVCLATSLPNQFGEFVRHTSEGSPERHFLTTFSVFVSIGSDARALELRAALIACLTADSDVSFFERSVLRLCRLALEQVILLSLPRVLREFSNMTREVRDRLVAANYRVLLPPQYRSIAEKGLLQRPGNAMLALPTSTGKTLLGSLCLLSALGESPGLVIYVTPWVAAARQAAETLNGIKPEHARVLRLIGGYDEEATIDATEYQEIVVATPERLDGLLRSSPDLVHLVRAVVFDEAHLVENGERGVRLEGIISRLRLLQEKRPSFRLVFISAVMAPDSDVQRWLNVDPQDALIDTWSPTARRLAMWTQSGRLEWYAGHDAIRRRGTDPADVIGSTDLLWPQPGLNPSSAFAAIRAQEPLARENVAYLVDSVIRRLGSPVLCVCATKAQTREIAAAVAPRLPVLEPLPRAVADIRALIDGKYPYLRQLRDVVAHGVAFHNSTVPTDVRQLIEAAVGQDTLRVITSTTTLAEGVDLPFRVTVIVDWLMWGNEGQRPMTPTLFRNIAGRAGRAGSFTDGDTILFDNPLGDPIFTHPRRRRAVQREFFLPEALPGLTSAFETAEQPNRIDLTAALASQFLAAIPENPASDDLGADLLGHLLVSNRPRSVQRLETIDALLDDIRRDLLDPVDTFAIAQSPLTLTPLGEAASRSGFAPKSVREILSALREAHPEPSVEGVAAHLLRRLAGLPEQPSEKVRGVLTSSRSRFWVKPADFEIVIRNWLDGVEVERIFVGLPIVDRTTITPPVNDWLSGSVAGPKWDVQFDTFIDFITSVVTGFLPWLFRACETLSPFVSGWSTELPWRVWAEELERPSPPHANVINEAESE